MCTFTSRYRCVEVCASRIHNMSIYVYTCSICTCICIHVCVCMYIYIYLYIYIGRNTYRLATYHWKGKCQYTYRLGMKTTKRASKPMHSPHDENLKELFCVRSHCFPQQGAQHLCCLPTLETCKKLWYIC